MIHLDHWWNPAKEDQADDRAHRIGQEKAVHTIKLTTAQTIEQRILQIQARKRAMFDAVMKGSESVRHEPLTEADIMWLLSPIGDVRAPDDLSEDGAHAAIASDAPV